MWRCIFDTATNRGVDWNREPGESEYLVALHPSRAAWFNVDPSRYMWTGTELVECSEWVDEQQVRVRVIQEQEIRSRYSAMLVSIAAPYGAAERETWKTQEEEARSWTADPDAPCPMIRAMATTRGIAMDLMVAKILNSAERFRAASGQILGLQQAELDILYPEKKEEV